MQVKHTYDRYHETNISGVTLTPQQIGTELVRLRYDAFLVAVRAMKDEISRQSIADHKHGRSKLSEALNECYKDLNALETSLSKVINICRPFLQKEFSNEKELS